MSNRPIAAALNAWLDAHPLARQVFRHVHTLERLLRRNRIDAVTINLLERAQDELRNAGFAQPDILKALAALEDRLWSLDRIGGMVVQEIAGSLDLLGPQTEHASN